MSRKQIILFVLASFLLQGAKAQDKLSIDLNEAKQHALQFNKNIQNSALSVQLSQEQLKQAIAAGLPQVDATADYNNALGAEISIQFAEGQPASQIPIDPTSSFNLTVGQLLFSANYWVGVQTAKLYQELSEKSQTKTERDVISQVVESYYLVIVSGEALEILQENVNNLQAVYEKTAPLVEFGMTEKVELDQLSVQLNSLKNAMKSAARQHVMAQNMLRLQLGVEADMELELTEELDELLSGEDFDQGLTGGFDLAQNIDFQLMEAQGKVQEKQVDMQKANYLPSLSSYYSFNHKILKPAFDMAPTHMVGLQMNIPIFSSGERRAKVRAAKIDMETYRNEQALLEDQLSIQYKQLSFDLKSALENFINQQNNIEVSRAVYKNLKQKYDQGMISSLELTSADNNYLKAESDFLQAALELLQAQNQLNTLTGKL
ncbi:TolC family protein [Sunxiuqinia sp. sy24]|uniref:TolC family protein n=1 Tax=Sunxiuqinia sp. sy24 TaxID=3461495 RepID=UPI00404665FD